MSDWCSHTGVSEHYKLTALLRVIFARFSESALCREDRSTLHTGTRSCVNLGLTSIKTHCMWNNYFT